MLKLTHTLIVLVVTMVVFLGGQIASAQPQPQQQQNRKKPKENPAATAANQAAANGRDKDAKADASKKDVAEANEAIRAAQKDVDEANKALKKVEEDTIDAQSAESDFGKARDAYREADKKCKDALKSVLDSESYRARKEAAKESEDSGDALRTLQKEVDEMPAVSDSRTAMQSAKETYDPLKTKLLAGTQDWVAANDDLKAKKKALEDAKHKYAEAIAAANRAKAEARKAEAEAQAAKRAAAVQQAIQQRYPPRGRH
jgi:chromosome segregation ATPase